MSLQMAASGPQVGLLRCTPAMSTRFQTLGGLAGDRSSLNPQEIAEHHLLYLVCSFGQIVVDSNFVRMQADMLVDAYKQPRVRRWRVLIEGVVSQLLGQQEPM